VRRASSATLEWMSEVAENLPAAPLTLDGASVLHQMFRIR
jgi:hypothetical protein